MKCPDKSSVAMVRRNLILTSTFACLLSQLVTAHGQSIDLSTSKSGRQSRFISFDADSGKIDIALDLSVPFLSIPLEDKNGHGGPPSPLVNVNAKALAVFGLLMALSAFVVPLFVKKIPEAPVDAIPAELHGHRPHHHYSKEHKRTDRGLDFSYLGDSLNEILFRDSRITPCIQRIVCSAVATSSRKDNPTSVDKILDGLSSLRWFEQAANGTVVQEAVAKGREVLESQDCTAVYKGCIMNQQFIANVLKILGI